MAARTWLGGRGNNAATAADWSPNGAPQPGDTLTMTHGTINIGANNPLGAGWLTVTGNATVNLTNTTGDRLNFTGAYQHPVLKDTVNLANSEVWITGHQANITIKASGYSHLFMYPDVPRGANLSATINNTGVLDGVFSGYSSYRINGGILQNDSQASATVPWTFGSSGAGFGGTTATINADVIGTGGWFLSTEHGSAGKLEFMQSVGEGQTVNLGDGAYGWSTLQIDKPGQFHGAIGFNAPDSVIDLPKLAADSYSYDAAAGTLDFWHGDTLLAAIRFSATHPYLVANNTSTGAAGVEVFSTEGAWNIPHGTLLYQHFMG